MIESGAVLPMCYLPPVELFVELNKYKPNVLIEREEHFPKQTYRNRASIYSPDGVLTLTVPVVKGSKNHTIIRDVKISYDFKWQRAHWMGLQTCYRSSAYFEYYEDDFAPFYEKNFEYLFDYNQQLMELLIKLTKIKASLTYTETYEEAYSGLTDLRNTISPKIENESFQQKPYFQVFEDRHGFIKNLSIVDLLFNQGPQTLSYL
jgi:hypothetical protein